MPSLEVDLIVYTDSDFNFSQVGPFANGVTNVGSNAVHMQVRAAAQDPTVWLEAGTANANVSLPKFAGLITITAGTDDTVNISIPQALLQNIPPGNYVYSAIMSTPISFQKAELFRGNFTVNAGPTQWQANTP